MKKLLAAHRERLGTLWRQLRQASTIAKTARATGVIGLAFACWAPMSKADTRPEVEVPRAGPVASVGTGFRDSVVDRRSPRLRARALQQAGGVYTSRGESVRISQSGAYRPNASHLQAWADY